MMAGRCAQELCTRGAGTRLALDLQHVGEHVLVLAEQVKVVHVRPLAPRLHQTTQMIPVGFHEARPCQTGAVRERAVHAARVGRVAPDVEARTTVELPRQPVLGWPEFRPAFARFAVGLAPAARAWGEASPGPSARHVCKQVRRSVLAAQLHAVTQDCYRARTTVNGATWSQQDGHGTLPTSTFDSAHADWIAIATVRRRRTHGAGYTALPKRDKPTGA